MRGHHKFIILCSCFLIAETRKAEASTTDEIINASKKSATVDEFIKNLPEEFKNNWTAMHTSDSAQSEKHATFQQPRIIMHDRDSNLLAFDAVSNKVEWIEFNNISKKWEFREVLFQSNQKGHIQKGKNCFACHTNEQPIWEGYPIWPGAYGALDEQMHKSSKELKEFKKFIEKAPNADRYKQLSFDGKKLVTSARNPDNLKDDQLEIFDLPNSKLSSMINHKQSEVFATLAVDKLRPKEILQMLYALLNCEELDKELSQFTEKLKKENLELFIREVKRAESTIPKLIRDNNGYYFSNKTNVYDDNGLIKRTDSSDHSLLVDESLNAVFELTRKTDIPFPDTSVKVKTFVFRPVTDLNTLSVPIGRAYFKKYNSEKAAQWDESFMLENLGALELSYLDEESPNTSGSQTDGIISYSANYDPATSYSAACSLIVEEYSKYSDKNKEKNSTTEKVSTKIKNHE